MVVSTRSKNSFKLNKTVEKKQQQKQKNNNNESHDQSRSTLHINKRKKGSLVVKKKLSAGGGSKSKKRSKKMKTPETKKREKKSFLKPQPHKGYKNNNSRVNNSRVALGGGTLKKPKSIFSEVSAAITKNNNFMAVSFYLDNGNDRFKIVIYNNQFEEQKSWEFQGSAPQKLFLSMENHLFSVHYSKITRWNLDLLHPDTQFSIVWEKNIPSINNHLGSGINSIAEIYDNGNLILGCHDFTVKQLDQNTGNVLHNFMGHEKVVTSVIYLGTIKLNNDDESKDKYFASGSLDGKIRIWNLTSHECKLIIDVTHEVWNLSMSPCGNILAAGCSDTKIRIYSIPNFVESSLATNNDLDMISKIAFSPDGRYLASHSLTRNQQKYVTNIISVQTGETVFTLENTIGDNNFDFQSMFFTNNGASLVSHISETGDVQKWDIFEKEQSKINSFCDINHDNSEVLRLLSKNVFNKLTPQERAPRRVIQRN